jgi:uncharacterized protein YciI
MKYFIVNIEFTADLTEIEKVLASHREFLQTYYDKGLLLMSGPKNPRDGGIVVAKAESLEEITEIFKLDPYRLNSVAKHSFIEFNPVKFADIVDNWID